jgi:hypothetical protein
VKFEVTMKKKEKEMRFRIDYDIFKKYRVLCTKLDLSVPKQTAQLISHFVSIQTENLEKIKEAERRGKENVGIYS